MGHSGSCVAVDPVHVLTLLCVNLVITHVKMFVENLKLLDVCGAIFLKFVGWILYVDLHVTVTWNIFVSCSRLAPSSLRRSPFLCTGCLNSLCRFVCKVMKTFSVMLQPRYYSTSLRRHVNYLRRLSELPVLDICKGCMNSLFRLVCHMKNFSVMPLPHMYIFAKD